MKMDRQEEVEMLAPSEKTKKYRLDGIDKPELKPIFASFFFDYVGKVSLINYSEFRECLNNRVAMSRRVVL